MTNEKNEISYGRWSLTTTPLEDAVYVGDELVNSRGDLCKVTGKGRPPHKFSSTGRIELDGRLYFPSVVGCKWREDWNE